MKNLSLIIFLICIEFMSCNKEEIKNVIHSPEIFQPKIKSIVLKEYEFEQLTPNRILKYLYQNGYIDTYNYIENTLVDSNKYTIIYSSNNTITFLPLKGSVKSIVVYSKNNYISKISISNEFYLFPNQFKFVENRRFLRAINGNLEESYSRYDDYINSPLGTIFSTGLKNFEYLNNKLISLHTYPRDTSISYPQSSNSEELKYTISYNDEEISIDTATSLSVAQVNDLVLNMSIFTKQLSWPIDDKILTFFNNLLIYSKKEEKQLISQIIYEGAISIYQDKVVKEITYDIVNKKIKAINIFYRSLINDGKGFYKIEFDYQ